MTRLWQADATLQKAFFHFNSLEPNFARSTIKKKKKHQYQHQDQKKKQKQNQDQKKKKKKEATNLFSLKIRNTFRFSICACVTWSPFTPLARGGNAPGPHLSCKSANASFVPSVSTTMVPYHPGSMKRLLLSGIGMRPFGGGPRVWLLYRCGPRDGRMENEERCTQRTTL